MLELKFVRCEPIINRTTNNVEAFIIGAVGMDIETTESEYIDMKKEVSVLKPLDQWSIDEIRQFCVDVAVEQNWYTQLALRIDARKNTPIIGQNITEI